MRYCKIVPLPAVEITLAQLSAENPDVSFGTDPHPANLSPYDVFPLIDLGPPAYDWTITEIQEIALVWTVVYIPASALETATKRSRVAYADFLAKVSWGYVTTLSFGTFLLAADARAMDTYRTDDDTAGMTNRTMYGVAGLVISLSPQVLGSPDKSEVLAAAEDYAQQCIIALDATFTAIAGGADEAFETQWAIATGSPVTGQDLLENVGVTGDGVASATVLTQV